MTLAMAVPRALTGWPLRAVAVERGLFWLFVAAGAGLVWLAPRPPMVDLPQHAAQVALWRDTLLGVSPWSDIVASNLLTPYLMAYGLMLPLSLAVSLATAAKIVLAVAYVAFAAGGVALRKAMGGDPRLDWLGPVGLFGYAWQWGFLTFVTAAPLGLFFLVLACRHAAQPTARTSGGLVALGIVCLFGHALVFLMAGAMGGLLAVRGLWLRRCGGLLLTLAPYAALGIALVALRLATRDDTAAFHYDGMVYGLPLWLRPSAALGYVTDMDGDGPPIPRLATAILLLAPLALRLPLNRVGGAWLFAGIVALVLALPIYAFETAGLASRFSLFVMPVYAVLFARGEDARKPWDAWALVALVAACGSTLAVEGARIAAFGRESRSFETVLEAAQPGHRALALIFDRASAGAENPQAYMHYAAWYGADKHGFVDFNFAAYPPQVMRFRPAHRPPVTSRVGWQPETFDWASPAARVYDYVFLRGGADDLASVQRASPCPLAVAASDGAWTLLQRGACPSPPR